MRADDRPRLELILRQNLLGTIAVVAVTWTFAAVAHGRVSPAFLIPWALGLNLSVFYRIYLAASWFRRGDGGRSVSAWWWRIRGALLVSGLGWATLGWVAPGLEPTLALFAISSVCGMSAAAIATYAPDLTAMFLVLWPASLGFALGQFGQGGAAHVGLGLLALLYAILLTRAGFNLHRYVRAFLDAARLRGERDAFAAADRAKLMFLANASHEIRTPLAAISGFAESALETRPLDPGARADLEVILRNGRHLSSIVGDLLDLTRSENSALPLSRDAVDPRRELGECVDLVRPAAAAKGLTLSFNPNALPARLVIDATRLRQITLNLLTNAIKYSARGEIRLEASFDRPTLRARVSDQGRGIPKSAREVIFEPFRRVEDRLPGAGLGLAVARELARRMGGDVRLITSEEHVGSVFEVTITTEGDDAAVATAPAAPPTRVDGRRILLAEDDPDLRALMERSLAGRGARVIARDNGAEAVATALDQPFDVILMDMKMPVLDGYAAVRSLRGRGYRAPIVALTAHASPTDARVCLEAGCDRYLSKPVNFPELLGVINELC